MLDILRTYLIDATSTDVFDAVDQAHSAFERIGLENYELAFEELLMTDDTVDAGQTVDFVTGLTKEFQAKVLQEHGVQLVEDTNMPMYTTIINGLLDIQDYENVHDIVRACESCAEPIEALAEVLSLVTAKTAEELMLSMEFVSAALIKRLIEQTNERTTKQDDDEEERTFRQARIAEFQKFAQFVGSDTFLAYDILRKGVDVGFPFMIYANFIKRDFERLEPQDAAINLVAMAIVSSDGYNTIQAKISDHIEEFIANPDVITRVTVAVTDLLVRFQQQ